MEGEIRHTGPGTGAKAGLGGSSRKSEIAGRDMGSRQAVPSAPLLFPFIPNVPVRLSVVPTLPA